MSAYKRANWHSGLSYRQVCESCKTTVRYTDHVLDFRPWFADGFVYCPKCNKPLRHHEYYAIDKNGEYTDPKMKSSPAVVNETKGETNFCTQCGNKVLATDNFCAKCGAKLK